MYLKFLKLNFYFDRRESQTKNQTETTKKIDEAIEQVEYTASDTIRAEQLKQMNENLKYSTKPSLKEFLEKERQSRNGPTAATARRQRTRSLSSSGRLEQSQSWTINPKYAKAKPKINSRPPPSQSARLSSSRPDSADVFVPHGSSQDQSSKRGLNDSTAIRFDLKYQYN